MLHESPLSHSRNANARRRLADVEWSHGARPDQDVLSLQLRQIQRQKPPTSKHGGDMLHRQRCNLDREHALDWGEQNGVYGNTRSQPDRRTMRSVDEGMALPSGTGASSTGSSSLSAGMC